jgi:hypothetical protein
MIWILFILFFIFSIFFILRSRFESPNGYFIKITNIINDPDYIDLIKYVPGIINFEFTDSTNKQVKQVVSKGNEELANKIVFDLKKLEDINKTIDQLMIFAKNSGTYNQYQLPALLVYYTNMKNNNIKIINYLVKIK